MKFPSFKSIVKRIPAAGGNTPASAAGNGAPMAETPGMVSFDEIAFFSESAARFVGKEGAIVDLGCWLGSTSIALAQGIRRHRPNAGGRESKVLGFDMFVWEEWMPAHIPYCLYQPGESFLPEARRVVSEHAGDGVELIQADLANYEWEGGPIKILLVDAMKNEDLARQIARTFYPSLVPGSLLIHQDFKHYYTTWIHLLQYRLRGYFRFDHSVPRMGTVAFELLAPIPREAVDRATDSAIAPDDEIDASFRHSLELVGPDDCINTAAAHVMHYVHLGRKDRAAETLEIYRSRGLADKGEFPKVLDYLNQMA